MMPESTTALTECSPADLHLLAHLDLAIRTALLGRLAAAGRTRLAWPNLIAQLPQPGDSFPEDDSLTTALCPNCGTPGLLLLHRFSCIATPILGLDSDRCLVTSGVSMPAPAVAEAPCAFCPRCYAHLDVLSYRLSEGFSHA